LTHCTCQRPADIKGEKSSLLLLFLLPDNVFKNSSTMPPKRVPLEIPQRVSSLLPAAQRKRTLEDFQKRTVSIESRLSTTSSVNEFINLKVENVEEDIRCYIELKQDIFESFRAKQITEKQHQEGLQDLQNKLTELKNEESVLKKQRKLLEEDVTDEMPLYSDVDEAYRNILLSKVAGASGKQSRQQHKFDKSTFRRKVKDFYGSSREISVGTTTEYESFCVLFGWLPQGSTAAAHLVPKSLNSRELQYLFGVDDDSMLSDPRVGTLSKAFLIAKANLELLAISLSKPVEIALDLGQIVIVPIDAAKTGGELEWMCLVTNKALLPHTLAVNTTYSVSFLSVNSRRVRISNKTIQAIHRRKLRWSNNNRPAKRYLHFRFIITYLLCKAKGQSTDWVNEMAAKGKMWCTPSPYLRRSMLQLLSKECGDHVLPEVFYQGQTFDEEGEGSENEKGMARELRDGLLLSSSQNAEEDDDEDSEDVDYDSEWSA
jgi:hypothetical protein